MRRNLTIAAAITAALASTAALSAPSPGVAITQAKAVVATASHGTVRAVGVFPGPDGLTGVITVSASALTTGPKSIVWVTPNGKAVLTGTLYGADGSNLNDQAMLDQGLRIKPAAALDAAVEASAKGILVGKHGPILTVFMDPNCIFCHKLYEDLTPEVEKGVLRIRYVLVGVVKPDSAAKSASIMTAQDPAKALAKDETAFNVAIEEGGYKVTKRTNDWALPTVVANSALMQKAGATGTPTLLYCSKSAKLVKMSIGMPSASALLGDLATGPAKACN